MHNFLNSMTDKELIKLTSLDVGVTRYGGTTYCQSEASISSQLEYITPKESAVISAISSGLVTVLSRVLLPKAKINLPSLSFTPHKLFYETLAYSFARGMAASSVSALIEFPYFIYLNFEFTQNNEESVFSHLFDIASNVYPSIVSSGFISFLTPFLNSKIQNPILRGASLFLDPVLSGGLSYFLQEKWQHLHNLS